MENNNSMVGGSGGQLMDGTSPVNGRADVRCNVKLLSDLIFGILPLETAPFLVAMSAWLSLGRILLLFSMPVCGQSFLIIFGPTYLVLFSPAQAQSAVFSISSPSYIHVRNLDIAQNQARNKHLSKKVLNLGVMMVLWSFIPFNIFTYLPNLFHLSSSSFPRLINCNLQPKAGLAP